MEMIKCDFICLEKALKLNPEDIIIEFFKRYMTNNIFYISKVGFHSAADFPQWTYPSGLCPNAKVSSYL